MQTLNIFRKPAIKSVIADELYEAERSLLNLEATTEHHAAMRDMQRERVARLKQQLANHEAAVVA